VSPSEGGSRGISAVTLVLLAVAAATIVIALVQYDHVAYHHARGTSSADSEWLKYWLLALFGALALTTASGFAIFDTLRMADGDGSHTADATAGAFSESLCSAIPDLAGKVAAVNSDYGRRGSRGSDAHAHRLVRLARSHGYTYWRDGRTFKPISK
jgi:hypothetical protein